MPLIPPMTDWMKYVTSPGLPLSTLSIPGTHDSASVSIVPFVGTQTLTIREQLDHGIRFFDLRITLKIGTPPYLTLVHGAYDLGLRLEPILKDMYAWLDKHDQEALIVQFKHDRHLDPHFTYDQFDRELFDLLKRKSKYWRFDATIPTLTQLRKRIQLVRRMGHPVTQPLAMAGLNVTQWKNNETKPFDIAATPGNLTNNIRVQDRYEYSLASDGAAWLTIPKKFELVKDLMKEAAKAPNTGPWFFNYTSAVSPWAFADPIIYAQGFYDDERTDYCDGVNKRVLDYLNALPHAMRCGTLMMDFPSGKYSADLILRIVQMNDLKP